ncbi:hypothetical protein FTX61_11785 [Nitriliruptoraceae bacterium ZYF776]|nr:hypothetical protein [Profundirhabdus halotolerans]
MPTSAQDSDATAANRVLVKKIRKRADQPTSPLGPCLDSYDARLADADDDRHPLLDLTEHLLGTLDVTRAAIRARMVAKWQGDDDAVRKVESSVTNSLRRSAGTNYQSLVSYAIARYLIDAGSEWYVEFPVPKELAHELSILFTAGVEPTAVAEDGEPDDDSEDLVEGEETAAGVTVKPDVDVLLRNASWDARATAPEPMLILSVKTSLADRAGSAARWKTYFDLVTQPCAHACEPDCAYGRLGIQLAYDPNVSITHGIVTANIYKVGSDPHFTQFGELRSNQARANTFMFDARYTTRNDTDDVMAEGWEALPSLIDRLETVSREFDLPL